MSDEVDIANAWVERELERALSARQRNANKPAVQSAEFCESCGFDIPEARRKAVPGVQQCVECQAMDERVKRTLTRD